MNPFAVVMRASRRIGHALTSQRSCLQHIVIFLVGALGLTNAWAGDVANYYDALGRLIETVGTDGSSVQYTYDAVGNILNVQRKASNSLSISGFVPSTGDVGTVVTVFGSGFNTSASANVVKLGSIAVNPTSVTATSFSFTVPSSAISAAISVSNSNGSAVSASQFILSLGKSPQLTDFTPKIGGPGTSVNISGSNFQTNLLSNKVFFSKGVAPVSAATTSSINTISPTGVRSGRLAVTTPFGTSVSTDDFYALPIDVSAASLAQTGRLVLDGASINISLPATKSALFIFDGVAGKYHSLAVTNIVTTSSVKPGPASIYRPAGDRMGYFGSAFSSATVYHTELLSTSDTYTAVVVGSPYASSTATVTLSTDIADTLQLDGTSKSFSPTRPGQAGYYSFFGIAGQNVVLTLGSNTFASGGMSAVLAPDRSSIATLPFGEGSLRLISLPQMGTYTVQLDPAKGDTGTLTISAQTATDATGTLIIDGAALAVSLGTKQSAGSFSFAGIAGQSLGLGYNGFSTQPPNGAVTFTVAKPDGLELFTTTHSGADSDPLPVLPTTGTYAVRVLPIAPVSIANLNLWLSREVTGTLISGGAGTTFATARPGQNGRFTFTANAGQNVVLAVSGNTFSGILRTTLYKPDGTQLATFGLGTSASAVEVDALPVSGTYTVFISPAAGSTGTVTVGLTSTGDVAGAATINGAPTVATLGQGQRGNYTFSATAGQALHVGLSQVGTAPAGSQIAVTVLKPDGSAFDSRTVAASDTTYDLSALPVSGNYVIRLEIAGPSPGTISANVWLSTDVSGAIPMDGSNLTFATNRPGQNGIYSFTPTAGSAYTLALSGNTFGSGQVRILNPNGSTLASVAISAASITFTPSSTGTYSIVVDPSGVATGTVKLALTLVGRQTGAISLDGAALAITLPPAQGGTYSVTVPSAMYLNVGYDWVSGSGSFNIDTSGSWSYYGGSNAIFHTYGAGTVNLLLDAPSTNAGSIGLRVWVSTSVLAAITPGAAPVTFSTARPGQGVRYSFAATAGQNLKVTLTGNSFTAGKVFVYRPDQTQLLSGAFNSGSLTASSLSLTGTYTLVLDPDVFSKGSITVGVTLN